MRTGSRAISRALSTRASWAVLFVVVLVMLGIGSVHRSPASRSARITYLESVIKCPVCENLSIAQSDVLQASELRTAVTARVDAGQSNAEIEQFVIDTYGKSEILSPPTRGLDAAVWVIPLLVIGVAAIWLGVYLFGRRGIDGTGIEPDDEALVEAARRTNR